MSIEDSVLESGAYRIQEAKNKEVVILTFTPALPFNSARVL